jgi:hypothetical protein
MLYRKLYQLYNEGQEIGLYLKDQQRYIERARIIDIEGDLITIRYETEEEDEVSSWEDMVRLDSIGAISRKLASVPKGHYELLISEDCPDTEKLSNPSPDANLE